MDIYQLKTFVAVAREGTITRASEVVHLSQPAVSAHIKAIEDTLGVALFERTPRGMSLTPEGQRLLAKAEQILAAHQDLMDEAQRTKAKLAGKLHLGAGSNSDHAAIGRLVTLCSERFPDVELALKHGTSAEVLAGLRNGSLDAGFYNEPDTPEPDLSTAELSRFIIHVVAPPGLVANPKHLDWNELAKVPWVYPTASACCGRTAERLFKAHQFRPRRIVSVDRVEVTRALVASGIGVGLLHDDTAREAERRGELQPVYEAPDAVRVLFAQLARRAQEPLLSALMRLAREIAGR
jgi:DNA-binding transcriptional LysR family regulator